MAQILDPLLQSSTSVQNGGNILGGSVLPLQQENGSPQTSSSFVSSAIPEVFSNQDTDFVKFLANIGSSMKEFSEFDSAEGSENASIPRITWKSVLKHSNPAEQKFKDSFADCDSEVIFNKDGSATINIPRSFLENAKKKWSTSCIGHFIGGSFPFKFVKEKVTKLWSNMGLQNVFFSSKGYFTFKFGTMEEMEHVVRHYVTRCD